MNSELLKSIIGLVAAIIPLIILIITLFRAQIDKTTEPIDSPSLKVVSIKRQSVRENVWIQQKRKSNFWLWYSYALLFLYLLFSPRNDPLNPNRIITAPIIYIALLCLITAIFLNTFTYRGKLQGPDNVRYFLFKKIDIKIVANFHYLFNKCHESLKSLGFKILELDEDEDEGILEACYIPFFGSAKLVNVYIERVDNAESTYMINVLVKRLDSQDKEKPQFKLLEWLSPDNVAKIMVTPIRRLFGRSRENEDDAVEGNELYERSKIINRFINRLISKP